MAFLAGVVATAAIASGAMTADANPSADEFLDRIWEAIDAGSLTTMHRSPVPGESPPSGVAALSGADVGSLGVAPITGFPLEGSICDGEPLAVSVDLCGDDAGPSLSDHSAPRPGARAVPNNEGVCSIVPADPGFDACFDHDALALVEFGVPLPDRSWSGALEDPSEGGPR